MNSEFDLSVVIPCLNEEKTIGICVKKALDCIHKNSINAEIIVSDNGSTDNSVKIVEEFNNSKIKLVHCCTC